MTGTHERDWLDFQATGDAVEFGVVIFFPWDPERRLFRGEKVHTFALDGSDRSRDAPTRSSSILPAMATLEEKMTVEDVAPGGQAPEVFRYYELAKKQEWQVRDMPWGDLPPIPEATGSKERVEKRRGIWRSVITQQLQADSLAVEMAAQLLEMARHHDAKLYYSTMAQDEARHVEAWLKLIGEAGGPTERDPYLDKLARSSSGSTRSRRRSSSCRSSSSG